MCAQLGLQAGSGRVRRPPPAAAPGARWELPAVRGKPGFLRLPAAVGRSEWAPTAADEARPNRPGQRLSTAVGLVRSMIVPRSAAGSPSPLALLPSAALPFTPKQDPVMRAAGKSSHLHPPPCTFWLSPLSLQPLRPSGQTEQDEAGWCSARNWETLRKEERGKSLTWEVGAQVNGKNKKPLWDLFIQLACS